MTEPPPNLTAAAITAAIGIGLLLVAIRERIWRYGVLGVATVLLAEAGVTAGFFAVWRVPFDEHLWSIGKWLFGGAFAVAFIWAAIELIQSRSKPE